MQATPQLILPHHAVWTSLMRSAPAYGSFPPKQHERRQRGNDSLHSVELAEVWARCACTWTACSDCNGSNGSTARAWLEKACSPRPSERARPRPQFSGNHPAMSQEACNHPPKEQADSPAQTQLVSRCILSFGQPRIN